MTNKSVFSHTHHSFCEFIQTTLGKGRQHAAAFYEALMRKGEPDPTNPIFNNAPHLFKTIQELVAIPHLKIIKTSDDGKTGKFLLQTSDQLEVESVLIPMQSGGTLCISSQVGCRMGCTFCETGRMGLLRSLTTEEIVYQVFAAKFQLGFKFRNIVFMGMGEPFDNYEAVLQAARIFMDNNGLGFGRKNVTISTSGRVEEIRRFAAEGRWAPNLAISINAPTDEKRNLIMPINRKHGMSDLYAAMKEYGELTKREILVAYVLLEGMNDTLEMADQLANYLRGLPVKINLIPYNSQSCDRFKAPPIQTLENFAARLRSHGYYTLLRLTKGAKIMAACGQLGNLQLRRQLASQKKLAACDLAQIPL